jgi:uncharacterized membrane protein (UPF0127 family)
MRSSRSRVPLVFLALCLAACSAGAAGAKRLPAEELRIEKRDGSAVALKAEIAATAADRERGLMFRKNVPDGEGMLFVFESDQRLAFWMKNTLIPLSIAYVSSDGTIREILDMEPLSLASVESSRSVRYALEVPQGWFGRVGVAAGDRIVVPAAYRP